MAVTVYTDISDQDMGAKIIALETAPGAATTATTAELNALHGAATTVTVAAPAGAANTSTITIVAKDASGNTVAGVQYFELFMSSSSTGTTISAASYSGTLVASTGTIVVTLTAKLAFLVATDATGTFVGTLTDTGKTAAQYVAVRKPAGAGLVVSSAVAWG